MRSGLFLARQSTDLSQLSRLNGGQGAFMV
jgi:hypothetical protein